LAYRFKNIKGNENCFAKIINNTPAQCDQDHLKIIIANNPKIPDRTSAILHSGTSPIPSLLEGLDALISAGVDFAIIHCVTVHYFIDELRQNRDLKILSILDAVTENIRKAQPQIDTVGLLATDGTIASKIFQKRLAVSGIKTVVCNDSMQQRVMKVIYQIKNDSKEDSQTEITGHLVDASESLVSQGAQAIIAGCTEIPLALAQKDIEVPYFDSLLILARTAIAYAGRQPI
jgi:aspartate racemase